MKTISKIRQSLLFYKKRKYIFPETNWTIISTLIGIWHFWKKHSSIPGYKKNKDTNKSILENSKIVGKYIIDKLTCSHIVETEKGT